MYFPLLIHSNYINRRDNKINHLNPPVIILVFIKDYSNNYNMKFYL